MLPCKFDTEKLGNYAKLIRTGELRLLKRLQKSGSGNIFYKEWQVLFSLKNIKEMKEEDSWLFDLHSLCTTKGEIQSKKDSMRRSLLCNQR